MNGYRGRNLSIMHGGWPYSAARGIATRSPADYFEAEADGQSELNLRPEWMGGYRHDQDWQLLQLTENPYCGERWRIFEGHGVSKLAAVPLPNTGGEEPIYFARDDQHGWFYHAVEISSRRWKNPAEGTRPGIRSGLQLRQAREHECHVERGAGKKRNMGSGSPASAVTKKSFDCTIGGGDRQPCAALGSNPILVRQHGTRRKQVFESEGPIIPQRPEPMIDFQSGFINRVASMVQELLTVP